MGPAAAGPGMHLNFQSAPAPPGGERLDVPRWTSAEWPTLGGRKMISRPPIAEEVVHHAVVGAGSLACPGASPGIPFGNPSEGTSDG
jgi:hypothetical protein